MQITEISTLPRAKVDQLLSMIPFYRDVKQQEPWQYEVLLQHSRIVNFDPAETVIAQGDTDTWMYYVLKGQLVVYPGPVNNLGEKVNEVTPGEIFGDLAMLIDGKRMATILADEKSKEVQVFGTDFSIFKALNDFSMLSLKTKLIFYRRMVHSVRWKLEQYKMEQPTHRLVEKLRSIKLYLGVKDGEEELAAHYQQATDLVTILNEWNAEFGSNAPHIETKEFDPTDLGNIDLS